MSTIHTTSRELLFAHWRQTIRDAALVIRDGAEVTRIGLADFQGPRETAELEIKRPSFYTRTLTLGSLGLGEAYMDGDFEATTDNLHALWKMLVRNRAKEKSRLDPVFAAKYASILAYNRLRPRASNIHQHYDIGDEVYESFLGSTMAYTCGYAKDPNDDLDTLQNQKLDRVCQKLRLKSGETMLDLGCGYGSLLIHAAKHYGVRGIGYTNSRNHCSLGMRRAAALGVADKVDIRYGDFQEATGTFDKIASIGMAEHLLESQYDILFRIVATQMHKGGLALIHTACTNSPVNRHDPFIQKYIFPGSNWPSLIQMTTAMAHNGLALLDVENIGRHYVYTLLRWSENFEANRHKLDPKRYDERFIRMFRFYLAWGVGTASGSDGGLYHFLLTNDHALPHPLQRI